VASPTLPDMGDETATVTTAPGAPAPSEPGRAGAGTKRDGGKGAAGASAKRGSGRGAAGASAKRGSGKGGAGAGTKRGGGKSREDTSGSAAGQSEAPENTPDLEHGPPPPSLSPSRAGDFLTCPLLYRFRVIDRLPEPPSPAAARGTLVHAVLERLFDRPPAERTPDAAHSLVQPEWSRLLEAEPELAVLFPGDEQRSVWLAEVATMLDRYFTLEDPRRIEPAHRELCVEAELSSGLRLRGYIDRLDVAPGGDMRIVDYKTGGAPPEEFEARALFQMRFYALTLWRAQGRVPKLLQLMYLGNGEIVRYAPDEADLLATERKIVALWQAIERARLNRDWRPRPGRICDWCAHQAICPAFGGTPPPVPDDPPQGPLPEPRDGSAPV
jgi:putative RecB family exonuclease